MHEALYLRFTPCMLTSTCTGQHHVRQPEVLGTCDLCVPDHVLGAGGMRAEGRGGARHSPDF
jgi:hypothetical protein